MARVDAILRGAVDGRVIPSVVRGTASVGLASVSTGGWSKQTALAAGLPPGWTPTTTISGNTTVSVPGTTYTDVRFNGWVLNNAALMIKPDTQTFTGLDIQYNWIYGGGYTINCANDNNAGTTRLLGTFGTISNNFFDRTAKDGRQISMPANASCITVNNVFEEDGFPPITVWHNG